MKREFFLKQAKKISFVLLFTLFFFSFCSTQEKENKEIIAKIYVDLLVVEEFYTNPDSIRIKKAEVFDKYQIDKAVYNESLINLSSDQKEWDEFFSLANKYLDTLKAHLELDLKKTNLP